MKKFLMFFMFFFVSVSLANAKEIIKEKTFYQSFDNVSKKIENNLSKYYGKDIKIRNTQNSSPKSGHASINWDTIYDNNNKNPQRDKFKIFVTEAEEGTNVKLFYDFEYSEKRSYVKPNSDTMAKYYNDFWSILETENSNSVKEKKYRYISGGSESKKLEKEALKSEAASEKLKKQEEKQKQKEAEQIDIAAKKLKKKEDKQREKDIKESDITYRKIQKEEERKEKEAEKLRIKEEKEAAKREIEEQKLKAKEEKQRLKENAAQEKTRRKEEQQKQKEYIADIDDKQLQKEEKKKQKENLKNEAAAEKLRLKEEKENEKREFEEQKLRIKEEKRLQKETLENESAAEKIRIKEEKESSKRQIEEQKLREKQEKIIRKETAERQAATEKSRIKEEKKMQKEIAAKKKAAPSSYSSASAVSATAAVSSDVKPVKIKPSKNKKTNKKQVDEEETSAQEQDINTVKSRTYNASYKKVYSTVLNNLTKKVDNIAIEDPYFGEIATGWIYQGNKYQSQSFSSKRRYKTTLKFKRISSTKTRVDAETQFQTYLRDWINQPIKEKTAINYYNSLFNDLGKGLEESK